MIHLEAQSPVLTPLVAGLLGGLIRDSSEQPDHSKEVVLYLVPTTALNVLCRDPAHGATESDFYHSKVYDPGAAIEALRNKGYRIASRMEVGPDGGAAEPRYFIKMEEVRETAFARRKPARDKDR